MSAGRRSRPRGAVFGHTLRPMIDDDGDLTALDDDAPDDDATDDDAVDDLGDSGGRPLVLVTGASRGIGASTAVLAARRGWDVVVNYASNAAAADSVVERCVDAGVDAVAIGADVSDEIAVEALYREIDDQFGRLDAVVNNAGVLGPQGTFDTFDGDRLRRVVEINVLGAMYVAREAARRMMASGGGSIVNVSSRASVLGSAGEYVDYAATKGAVDTLTIGLATELGPHGVRVNAVRPGVIDTDIHASGGEPGRVLRVAPNIPLRRGGHADEVAATIVWLMSDDASYVSGTMLDVAGGR